MNGLRRALGILLIIAGPVVVAVGYRNVPSARVMANGIVLDPGKPATCSTAPSVPYYVTAAALVILLRGRRPTRPG